MTDAAPVAEGVIHGDEAAPASVDDLYFSAQAGACAEASGGRGVQLPSPSPLGGDPASDFRWALERLVARGTRFSIAEVARTARRSRTLIGFDGCQLPDVRREVLEAMAKAVAGQARRCTPPTSVPAPRIRELEAQLRRSDSRNAVLVARALDAERGRKVAEGRLLKLRERNRERSSILDDPCEAAAANLLGAAHLEDGSVSHRSIEEDEE